MKNRGLISRRQRIFETLEPRHLLAGNVTADTTTNPGALTVIGDSAGNIITITQVATDTYKVAGTATTVNGSSSAQTFTATNGIFVNLNGGSDVLTVKNLTINGESGDIGLGIKLEAGADVLLVTGVTVDFKTAIDSGEGNNTLVINSCNFNYDLGVQTHDGTDAVTITNTHINGALKIQLGNGTANTLTMVNVTVSEVALGGPDMIPLPPGFESLESALPELECGAVIEGGTGVDVIVLNNVKIDCVTDIDTDGGVDSVTILYSRFGNQLFDGLVEPDLVTDGALSGLCIETGLGNDAVSIVSTTVYGFLQIDTSDQIPCPTDHLLPLKLITPVNDGVDAVALTKVNVRAAAAVVKCATDTNESVPYEWSPCLVHNECGELLIYTGNQTDAVALAYVNTDCEATIRTTDLSDSSLDGADAVAISYSNFNQNVVVMTWFTLTYGWGSTGLEITTGRGNDAVSIVTTNVNDKTRIETGNGTDVVSLAFLATDHLCVRMGSGNYDVLTVSNCTATDEVFDGGDGSGDLLNFKHLNNHFATPPVISGFETVI